MILVKVVCCGHEEGIYRFPSWQAADDFRIALAGAPQGHERIGIILPSS